MSTLVAAYFDTSVSAVDLLVVVVTIAGRLLTISDSFESTDYVYTVFKEVAMGSELRAF